MCSKIISSKRTIFVNNMLDYLLCVPISARRISGDKIKYTPLIFNKGIPDPIEFFIKEYKPNEILTVDCEHSKKPSEKILKLLERIWDSSERIVLSPRGVDIWGERICAIYASQIAQVLGCPLLWVEKGIVTRVISSGIRELGVREVVIVGE